MAILPSIPKRNLSGKCQLHRPQGVLRRGEAGGRNPDDGLSSPAWRGHPHRPRLQSYGPRMAMMTAGGEQLYRPGPPGERRLPITKGQQTHSFCFVSNLIRGLIAMMEQHTIGPVNLGNPNAFTILSLAKRSKP